MPSLPKSLPRSLPKTNPSRNIKFIQEYQIHPGMKTHFEMANPFRNASGPFRNAISILDGCVGHARGVAPRVSHPHFEMARLIRKSAQAPVLGSGLWALGTGLRRTWASCSRTVSPASCWHQHSEPHWAIWRATLKQGLPRRRALSEATRVRPRPPSGRRQALRCDKVSMSWFPPSGTSPR